MRRRLIDDPKQELSIGEISFLGWMHSEYLNMSHGRVNAIPPRSVLAVGHLRGRLNVWLCGMQEKDNFLKVKFYDEVRMCDMLGSCGFEVIEGLSGKRCYWPDRDYLGAQLHMVSGGKIGKPGPMIDYRDRELGV